MFLIVLRRMVLRYRLRVFVPVPIHGFSLKLATKGHLVFVTFNHLSSFKPTTVELSVEPWHFMWWPITTRCSFH